MVEPPESPVEPTLLHVAVPFYGIVTLFALGFALFGSGITRLFGDAAARPAGLLGGLGVGLGLVALTRVGASGWPPMMRMVRSLEDLIGPITWTTALLLALVSGIAEELLFRGALWPHLGLIGTTLLFGLVHVLPRRRLWLYPVFATFAGLLFGLIREGTGSVWPPIVAHVTVNALNLWWLGARGPRPRVVDHLHVLVLFFQSWMGLIPGFLWVPLSPLLKPWVRHVLRRRLQRAGPCEADEPPAPDPGAWEGKTVFVVAGEPSGDALAARVVTAMLVRCPGLRVRGYAGPRTQAAGAELDRQITEHAVVGVWAVLRSFGTWWKLCADTLALWRQEKPDILLTVDFPGLNARLARWAKKRDITTVHLVPPAVWAYMPWRFVRWRLAVDRMLTVFPFEPPMFEGSGIHCVHVGHPGFEAPLPPPRTPSTYPEGGCVELLPGSRRQEIRGHATLVLEAAARIEERLPDTRFVLRFADAAHLALFEEVAGAARARPSILDLRVGEEDGREDRDAEPLLGAVAASGTVTAELGAALVPHVLFYRVSPVVRFGAVIGLTAPWIGLVNLIARREIAVERIMVRPDGRAVGDDFLASVATEADWRRTRAALEEHVRRRLEIAGVADRAARAVLDAYPGTVSLNHAPVGDASTASKPSGGPS